MSNSNPESERDLVDDAKRIFDRSVDELDGPTRSRLTQARHRALQELAPRGAARSWRWTYVPAGALAAAALVAVLLWQREPAIEQPLQADAVADIEILLGEEDLDMLDEELEFYAWLEEQPDFTPPAGDGIG